MSGVFLIVALVLFCLAFAPMWWRPKAPWDGRKLTTGCVKLPSGETRITVTDAEPGECGQFWVYVGSGTVWHEYPSGRRCSTLAELKLTEIRIQEKWRENGV